jgi:hypothetical protein
MEQTYQSYSGSLSSVNITVGGRTVPTGPISFDLDPTFGANNYWNINFDNRTNTAHVHLLLTSPLSNALGQGPIPILISETGPLNDIPLITPGVFEIIHIQTTTAGGGTIQKGIFAGFSYLEDCGCNVNLGSNNKGSGNNNNPVNQQGQGQVNDGLKGDINSKNGQSQPTEGNAKGTTTNSAPEGQAPKQSETKGQQTTGTSDKSLSFNASTGILTLSAFPLRSAYTQASVGEPLHTNRIDSRFVGDPLLGATLSSSPYKLIHSFIEDGTTKFLFENFSGVVSISNEWR